MTQQSLNGVQRAILTLLEVRHLLGVSDQELVQRFAQGRDEAAFRVIAERHGPMVQGVCLRALGCSHDAEDAFQATFLIFSQRAGSIRNSTSLASWLHGVARRVVKELLRGQRRRQQRERTASTATTQSPLDELSWAEIKTGLDEELERLPATYREVLVLCYLEGQSRDEAAQRLGIGVGVVKGRLERGRRLLAERLTKRGLALSAGLLTVALSPNTVSAIVRAGSLFAAGESLDPVVSPAVRTLTRNVLKGMVMTQLKVLAASFLGAVLLVVGVGLGIAQSPGGTQPAPMTGTLPLVAKNRDTDAEFIRRISNDLRGVDPTPAEVHFFVNNKDAKKRDTLVDLFIKEREAKQQQAGREDANAERAAEAGLLWLRKLQQLEEGRRLEGDRIDALKKKLTDARTDLGARQTLLEELEAFRKFKADTSAEGAQRIETVKAELVEAHRQVKELSAQFAAEDYGLLRATFGLRLEDGGGNPKKPDRLQVEGEMQFASLSLTNNGIATVLVGGEQVVLDCGQNETAQKLVTGLARKYTATKTTAVNLPRVAVKGWLEARPGKTPAASSPSPWALVVESLTVVEEQRK